MKARNWRVGLVGALLTVLGVGCSPGPSPEFDEAVPEMEALQLEVTGNAASEGLARSGLEGTQSREDGVCSTAPACAARPEFCTAVPNFLLDARNYVKDLNDAVRIVVAPIAEIIQEHPQVQTGTEHVWAPRDVGNLTLRFTMVKASTGMFGWKLDARPKGDPSASYQTVMAGAVKKGALPRRGDGTMGVDLDRVHAMDPSFNGRGLLLMAFKHAGNPSTTTLAYALKDFTINRDAKEAVSGLFEGVKLPSGERRVRLIGDADVRCSATPARERLALRTHWIPGVGGRADGLALGGKGDVPAGRTYVGSACWGADFTQGYFLLRDCERGLLSQPQCSVLQSEGTAGTCGVGMGGESLPSEDANDPTPEEGGETLELPASMPTGDGT